MGHLLCNKGEPDIVGILSQIIVRNPWIIVYNLNEHVNLIFRHLCGTEGANKVELSRMKIAADSPDNSLVFHSSYRLNDLILC